MPAKKTQTKGTCKLCGHSATSATMTRHLQSCTAAHDGSGPAKTLVLMRLEATYNPDYWLYAEIRSDTSLGNLDDFLRALWLECCGHMSAFSLERQDLSMKSTIGKVFEPKGQKFSYEYDFGSSTNLTGHTLGTRTGSIGKQPLRLAAQNDPLAWNCAQCNAPATIVCPFCIYDGDATFCDKHADKHEHADEEIYLPVVNSPRMGVCGYAG